MKDKILILLPFIIFCFSLRFTIAETEKNIVDVFAKLDDNYEYLIIVDPGHGGEDGGAVGFDGTLEKDLNLEISYKVASLFDIFGIAYEFTRKNGEAIGDTKLPTIRERKVSDIHKRFEIINSYDNSILLSIHQNFYPVEKYSGAQVFYSDTELSDVIAQNIQQRIRIDLQFDNKRTIKKTTDDIYLLHKAKKPSVMVECGFMSNPQELFELKDWNYQQRLSYGIVRGMIDFLSCQSL